MIGFTIENRGSNPASEPVIDSIVKKMDHPKTGSQKLWDGFLMWPWQNRRTVTAQPGREPWNGLVVTGARIVKFMSLWSVNNLFEVLVIRTL